MAYSSGCAKAKSGKTRAYLLLILFGSMIGLILLTWYLYQQQMIPVEFADKLCIHETQRTIHLRNDDSADVLKIFVGTRIPTKIKSSKCELFHPGDTPYICEEWSYHARLRVSYDHHPSISCYHIKWESLSIETTLRDCISLKGAYWYGMGEVKNMSWPLSGMLFSSQPFVIGDLTRDDFGEILEPYWLSSKGVAILVSKNIPLNISLNATQNDQLCLEAKYDNFPYYYNSTDLQLEYRVCTGADMKSVHIGMLEKYFPPVNVSLEFLEVPIWATAPKLLTSLTQESLRTYSNHIMDHGFPAGFILIDTKWQEKEGQLVFNSNTFPDPPKILRILHNKGFKLLLSITPYICLGNETLQNSTEEHNLVTDEKQVPFFTRWGNDVCGIVDITNNRSQAWFHKRILDVKAEYGVDGFYFFGGYSSFLPPYYKFNIMTTNPDNFLSLYLKLASETSSCLGVSVGFHSQHISVFVRIAPRTSTWDEISGLKSIIPSVLTLGLLGYPLVNPGSVGGDIFPSSNATIPDKELYIRWLQLAAFMPVVQFSVPPGDYDLDVILVSKRVFKIREDHILQSKKNNEYIKRILDECRQTHAPIIRPIWWLAPRDPQAQIISTQFAVGNDLIVAPVLEEGKRSRDIYLPPGKWEDALLGTSRIGGKWIYNYSVPLDKVAFFRRVRE